MTKKSVILSLIPRTLLRATGKSIRYYIKLGSITSTMMMDVIVCQKPVNTKWGKLYLTLYIKQQTGNIFILDRVNIRWLTNKGLVWAFHLDKLTILTAVFLFKGK